MDLSVLYPRISYPVSRGTQCLSELIHFSHIEDLTLGLKSRNYAEHEKDYSITLNNSTFRNIINHKMNEKIYVPLSVYLVS